MADSSQGVAVSAARGLSFESEVVVMYVIFNIPPLDKLAITGVAFHCSVN